MNKPKPVEAKASTLWIIWAGLCAGVVITQFVLGHGIPTGENEPGSKIGLVGAIAFIQILAASAIRWILVPRADALPKQLVLMVLGLALSEGVQFYGLFLVPANQPSTKLALWILSLASCVQFIPLYARTKAPDGNQFRSS